MPVSKTKKPTCVLDQAIVNEKTIGKMSDLGLSFFADLCGRNRGAFVLDPSDGNTWGCTSFPSNFAELAGVNISVGLKDANAIKENFQGHNVTAADTVAILDYFVKMVYHSSADVDKDPYACNTGGLTHLQCDPVNSLKTVRSVTLAGLLVSAPWATGGQTLTLKQAKAFYGPQDFAEMRKLGLNTVQVPVPVQVFDPNEPDVAVQDFLTGLIAQIQDADLQVILELKGEDNDDTVAAAAHYAVTEKAFALTLPSGQSLRAARAAETALPLLVPVSQGQLAYLDFPDENVFGALDLGHTSSVGDVASSTSKDDRMKLFYHENKACIARSPLEYTKCFRRVPLLVASGFDLSIDDCVHKDDPKRNFIDYGQCDRFEETVNSPWWHRHRKSFAARQLASYEQGLGWTFAAWKLYNGDDDDDADYIDAPAKLLSLKDVAAAGLFPKIHDKTHATTACLNPPESDFVLGDDTLAPTPGPLPDCGNGWWNYSISNCTYWVPPKTDPPSPTNVTTAATMMLLNSTNVTSVPSLCPKISKNGTLEAGGIGLIIGVIVALIGTKLFGQGRRQGYSEIPN